MRPRERPAQRQRLVQQCALDAWQGSGGLQACWYPVSDQGSSVRYRGLCPACCAAACMLLAILPLECERERLACFVVYLVDAHLV